jgi:hypothetical protein
MPLDVRIFQVPVAIAWFRIQRGRLVVIDNFNNARSGADR